MESHKTKWYRHWYVPGLATVLIGLVLLIIPGLPQPLTASLSLLIAWAVFSISWSVERQREEVKMLLNQQPLAVLSPYFAQIDKPYLVHLRDRLLKITRDAASQLADEKRMIDGVDECFDLLQQRLENYEGTEIIAVCGQKDWTSGGTQLYYQQNYERSRQGVKIKRLFIEPTSGFSREEAAIICQHLDPGLPNVEARIVAKTEKAAFDRYHFPKGFGFAIIGAVVIVHWGLHKDAKDVGRKYSNPWIVEEHRRIFNLLWKRYSRAVDPAQKRELCQQAALPASRTIAEAAVDPVPLQNPG